MGLKVETFTNREWRPGNNFGGSSLFKALGHPLTTDKALALVARLKARGPVAVYDPLGQAETFDAIFDLLSLDLAEVFVQQVAERGADRLGRKAELVTALPRTRAKTLLVACFDAQRFIDHVRHLVPAGVNVESLDSLRLPDAMLSDKRNYLAPVNFATNFAMLREGHGHHTRVVTANYWGGYGAKDPQLWLSLFDAEGAVLQQWFEPMPGPNASIVLDSRDIARRFGLGAFTGSLFIHAVRINGHDVVKYALDTYGDDGQRLSCTHDANAWPADLYGGVPAPRPGEQVVLWVQNSHPLPIPSKGVGFNLMGSQDIAWVEESIPAFGTRAIDVGKLLPMAQWPSQIEVQAGRYFVRPRYEVTAQSGRMHIAHANVERTDLKADPKIPDLGAVMGKGYVLPLPVLPVDRFDTTVLPTPMTTAQRELPISLALYDGSGTEVARKFLGRIERRDSVPTEVSGWLKAEGKALAAGFGHVEYLYDFRNGGEADGWLHGIARFRQKSSGHEADTSFGAHIYNTPIVYRDEPQSYVARPPGLSTRLFLRLGPAPLDTQCHLIYPASTPWHATSDTALILTDGTGQEVARKTVRIPCSGSLHWTYHQMFAAEERALAGAGAYVLVRDMTCRLFGFHGLIHGQESFCLDHMFGF